jgi:lysine 2,3-aminomutase
VYASLAIVLQSRCFTAMSSEIYDVVLRCLLTNMQYYVYQCDMVQGIEDLRTPLQEIIDLDKRIRGTLSGFMMPAFVVDLPGGGGKRLVSTHDGYKNGVATYHAPGLDGTKGIQAYTYYDPKPVVAAEIAALREHQVQALNEGQTLDQVVQRRIPATVPAPLRDPAQAPRPEPGAYSQQWAPTR